MTARCAADECLSNGIVVEALSAEKAVVHGKIRS